MQLKFERIAIVNRGEAAMRFLHAAREFNDQNGTSLRTIALFTESDRNAMFVRESDENYCLGGAHSIDPVTRASRSSYVDYELLAKALAAVRAEAVWVGWGFVAEHAAFADLCRELGIVFIGPTGDVMRKLGDKISAKRLAEEAQIPIVPWSGGSVDTLADAERHAARIGYPLLIKATAGGGGHGIRRVKAASELANAFESARTEAHKSFGDPTVYMEQLLLGVRHVEVQVIGDHYGKIWAVGVRDCTIQRRHQKLLEEAPSPALSAEQDQSLRDAAVRLSKFAGYQNAGTVEFLYEPKSQRFLFMEMNTRLQVEHPVTECTTGLDLVKLQMHVALGGHLEGEAPRTIGHAIEVRLNAEDPDNGFAPAPGVLERFRFQAGPGVRLDTGVAEGDHIPVEFDSMLAKIIAQGRNRDEALSRLKRALRESVVVIKGGASNKSFLLEILNRPEIREGKFDVGWMERLVAKGQHSSQQHADVALLQAAIATYDAELAVEQAQFYASAVRGRPQVQNEIGTVVALRYRGQPYRLTVRRLGPQLYRVQSEDAQIDVARSRLSDYEYSLECFGRRFMVVSAIHGSSYRIEVEGVTHCVARDDGGMVHAPAPAVVVSLAVMAGDTVKAGDRLAVLEAMKMEMQVVAPFGGKVRDVLTIPNVQVNTGDPLVQIDPFEGVEAASGQDSVVLRESLDLGDDGKDTSAMCLRSLRELRQLLLGFDVDAKQASRSFFEGSHNCTDLGDKTEISKCEDEILHIFADICGLFHREPAAHDGFGGEAPTSEAYLFSYLRALETRGEGLPPSFLEALGRTLAYYGIHSLERSPQLEESLLWIYKSHQRMEQQIAIISALLERHLSNLQPLPGRSADSFRKLLERIVALTVGSYPVVSDLARELIYRSFDQPMFERARQQVYAQAEEHLAYLAVNPAASDRQERISALVDCPQPLLDRFAKHLTTGGLALRQLTLEVLTRRYYRVQGLSEIQRIDMNGQRVVSAEYDDEGRHVHLFTTHAEFHGLPSSARALLPFLQEIPAGHEVAIDFYIWHPEVINDPETIQNEIRATLSQVGFPASVQRIIVAIGGPRTDEESGSMQHFTFRTSGAGFEEDKMYRGFHPMMGKRLHIWRLSNFQIERLPSVEDVYLFHAFARDNPKDERLFALAEVRDLTPVCDDNGRIVQLPHLERMFAEALAAIRLYQSRRSASERLYWNRILLNVRPSFSIKPEEFHDIVQRLAPSTEGLGLEQVVLRANIPNPQTGELRDMVVRISKPGGRALLITFRPAGRMQPVKPLTAYEQKVVRMLQRGMTYPYEIIRLLTPSRDDTSAAFSPGEFIEHDLDAENRLVPISRPYGENKSNIIVGVIRNFTPKFPEGMPRVLLMGDPSRELGSIAEPECRRIIAALDLADEMNVPVEWFPISAGAKISMESGVENMDWIARVLRRLVEFTQAGREVNLIVDGINVGAQPYWNAEATMLMHTRGILIMTAKAAMVLTGKRALDYSGSVSAEDNQGIGGYDRIMGLNGQAQYWAKDIDDACRILFRHYDHTYIAPGERFPRKAKTTDPIDRDVCAYPHGKNRGDNFSSIGEIFSDETNPGRKRSFDIRTVMKAVVDQDHEPLERWPGMRAAETAVVWDAHLGGYPVSLLGIESRPLPRLGFIPVDGPEQWYAGTLFPNASKKIARAINAATGNRPVVILANLSGFDGSPESMRKLQLEYGAEIGRAVVNFRGPMIFCVISRYHGGAYVVFSRVLNDQLTVAALEGTYASVIGGAPAAAVVFAGEVDARTRKDPRLYELSAAIDKADGVEKRHLRREWNELFKVIHSQKLGEVAAEFDRVHSVHRALKVGALHQILPPANLRSFLIHSVELGVKGQLELPLDPKEERPAKLQSAFAAGI